MLLRIALEEWHSSSGISQGSASSSYGVGFPNSPTHAFRSGISRACLNGISRSFSMTIKHFVSQPRDWLSLKRAYKKRHHVWDIASFASVLMRLPCPVFIRNAAWICYHKTMGVWELIHTFAHYVTLLNKKTWKKLRANSL